MSLLKRMAYMGFGALLVLALVIGGVAVFAQSGDDEATPSVVQDDDQNEEAQDDGEDADAEEQEESEEDQDLTPDRESRALRGGRGDWGDDEELLAEAPGISVEELEAAQEEVLAVAGGSGT